jgi:hypothetical protein
MDYLTTCQMEQRALVIEGLRVFIKKRHNEPMFQWHVETPPQDFIDYPVAMRAHKSLCNFIITTRIGDIEYIGHPHNYIQYLIYPDGDIISENLPRPNYDDLFNLSI